MGIPELADNDVRQITVASNLDTIYHTGSFLEPLAARELTVESFARRRINYIKEFTRQYEGVKLDPITEPNTLV